MLTIKKNYPIGLDISDLTLKMVQLKKVGDKIKIQALNRLEMPKGIMEAGEIKNRTELINKIKELVSKPKLGFVNSNEVVACLPETKTFIKSIEIEKGPNDIKNIIGAEIEKNIPLTIKEIYYDWQITEETSEKYNVLIGVAPQNTVNQFLEIINEAGLVIAALEIESVAICRSLLYEENPKFKNQTKLTYAIIDIGAQRSSMTIYSKNSIVMSISIPISGEKITEKIAKTLEIKTEQAEKAKIICGFDKAKAQGIIYEVLTDMLNDLNNKINDALEFYSNHYPAFGPVQKIIICGGGANINNIDIFIGQNSKIETSLGNIFVNLSENLDNINKNFTETHNLSLKNVKGRSDASMAIKQNSSLTYATAVGLALRKIFINDI